MKRVWFGMTLLLATAGTASAGTASGSVTSPTGTIAPAHALAFVVRDSRNPRQTMVELMLTDVAVDAASVRDDLDPHARAINVPEVRDRNYVLLWIAPDGSVRMNATYSETMTQYLNDSSGGLTAELTTNSPAKVEGRVRSTAPLKTMDGTTYTVDLTFSADVIPAVSGTPLPAGGGEPGQAFTAFLGAISKKSWAGIKAGLSPKALPNFEHDYNTPAEDLSSAVDILSAWLPMSKVKIAGGLQVTPTVAVLEMEGDRFGSRTLTLVRMVKTGPTWQFEQSAPAGTLR
jgi:hypothetical protein